MISMIIQIVDITSNHLPVQSKQKNTRPEESAGRKKQPNFWGRTSVDMASKYALRARKILDFDIPRYLRKEFGELKLL